MKKIFLSPFNGTKKQRMAAVAIGLCIALLFAGVWYAVIPLMCVILPLTAKNMPNVQE